MAATSIGYINNVGPQAFSGGNVYFQLTAAMGTTAQLIKGGAGRLCRIHNPQAGAATIIVYDAGSADATTLSSAVIIFKGTLPTAVQSPLDIQIPVQNGIVVVASGGAVAQTVLLTYL